MDSWTQEETIRWIVNNVFPVTSKYRKLSFTNRGLFYDNYYYHGDGWNSYAYTIWILIVLERRQKSN